MFSRLVIALATVLFILPGLRASANDCNPMSFKGKLSWIPLEDHERNVQLGSDFSFYDSACREWRAPKGHVVDGTSIPSIFWTFTSRTPFIGKHRRASAIHDVYYDLWTRPAHETHYAFYEALLADEVGDIEALLMYLAVTAYKPRWIIDESFVCPPGYSCANNLERHYPDLVVTPQPDDEAVKAAIRKVETGQLCAEQVKILGDELFFGAKLYRQVGTLKIETADEPIQIDRTADIDMPVEYLLRRQEDNKESALRNLNRRR